MSSRIDIIQRLITDRGRAEHIEIKGGPRHSGAMLEQPHRITRRFRMESRLHGCSTELAILEGCYLRVHSTRSRSELRKYELDLRYVTSRPVRIRRIAWLWLLAALVLLAAAVGVPGAWPEGLSLPLTLLGRVGAACAGIAALVLFVRRTTESLTFRSEYGLATLVEVMGGIGSTREGKPFFVELIKTINAARLERGQPKQEFLRDALREHHRLWQLGVLSEREYERSKARILAQH